MVSVWFVQGEQLTQVSRPGATAEDAVKALLAGPTDAEKAKGIRTQIPKNTILRSIACRVTSQPWTYPTAFCSALRTPRASSPASPNSSRA